MMQMGASAQSPHIPLIAPAEGGGYTLSPELLDAAGPLFSSNQWELKAFVCHVVSHFDDNLEHLLDFPIETHVSIFDVAPHFCDHFAKAYEKEFLPLPSEWYRELFRAKLESIRLPRALIDQAKLAYLSDRSPELFVARFFELHKHFSVPIPEEVRHQLLEAASLPAPAAWQRLEEICRVRLRQRVLPEYWLEDLVDSSWPGYNKGGSESTPTP